MLPEAFVQQLQPLLGGELENFLRAEEEPPALALRVNPLRPGAAALAAPYMEDPVPWWDGGFYVVQDARPGAALAHDLGAYYLQEASAMTAAAVLDARPGEKILDLCAAPGGKSTQLAGRMMGQGLLVCNEPVPSRAKVLAENLERMGVVNAVAVSAYPEQLAAQWPECFDAVLADAPCSGEGMFRRDPGAAREWNPGAPAGCARRQADILDAAAKLVRPGGRLVYSTCTFNAVEDEGSAERFLARHPEFEPEDFELPGIGRSQSGMIRVWPHHVRGDGHFAAKFRRAEGPVKVRKEKRGTQRNDAEERALLERLEAESCRIPECLRGGTLRRQGEYLHILPAGTPRLDGIRVVKPGLCVLRAGRSHVQPMPALARASLGGGFVPHMGAARRFLNIDEDGARRFRNGERFEGRQRGWTLLTHQGLPMGWTKVIQ